MAKYNIKDICPMANSLLCLGHQFNYAWSEFIRQVKSVYYEQICIIIKKIKEATHDER